HRLERALCFLATRRERLGQDSRRDLPRQSPSILAPAAGVFFAAVTDDGIPVAVCFFLRIGCDLKGEREAVLNRRSAVEAEAGNAEHGELHGQHVTLLSAWEISGR